MLNPLHDVLRRSQSVTDKEFISKLEQAGVEYTLHRIDSTTYIEVGRFWYRFNEEGKAAGGWIRNCAEDWRSEWQKWLALLNEPIS